MNRTFVGTYKLLASQVIVDDFFEVRDDAKEQVAPSRFACFGSLFAIFGGIVAFVVTAIFTARTPIIQSKLGYDVLGGKWTCYNLAPKSDQEIYNSITYESAQFSSSRYLLNECLDALGPEGYNLCAPEHRQEQVLSISGVPSNGEFCEDIVLSYGYRFCTYSAVETTMPSTAAFPISLQSSSTSSTSSSVGGQNSISTTFYFSNHNGRYGTVVAPFSSSNLKTDFVTDSNQTVFVVASGSDGHNALYMLTPWGATATKLCVVSFTTFDGLVYGGNAVFLYSINPKTNIGQILKYNIKTKKSSIYSTQDCSSAVSSSQSTSTSTNRFIDYGDDGYLYLMCTSSASVTVQSPVQGPSTTNNDYVFYKYNPANITLMESLNVDFASIQISGVNVTTVSQIVVVRGVGYASTGSPTWGLIKISLSAQPTLQPTSSPSPSPSASPSAAPTLGGGSGGGGGGLIPTMLLPPVNVAPTTSSSSGGSSNVVYQPAVTISGTFSPLPSCSGSSSGSSAGSATTSCDPYISHGLAGSVYNNYGNTFYNATTGAFHTSSPALYYTALTLQVGFTYGVCNGNITTYSVDYTSSTSFFSQCKKRQKDHHNGLYYQSSTTLTVPSACAGTLTSVSSSQSSLRALLACPAMEFLREQFNNNTCIASIPKVCNTAYTDNPPFTCEMTVYPDPLTIIGTAYANGSGAFGTLVFMLIFCAKYFLFNNSEKTEDFDSSSSEANLNVNEKFSAIEMSVAGPGGVLVSNGRPGSSPAPIDGDQLPRPAGAGAAAGNQAKANKEGTVVEAAESDEDKRRVYKAWEMRKGGFKALEMMRAGFNCAQLRKAGYLPGEIRATGCSNRDLRNGGFTIVELRKAGFSLQDMQNAGFAPKEMKIAGYSAHDMRDAGYSASDLKGCYLVREVMEAGYPWSEIGAAQFKARDLREGGFKVSNLREWGYGIGQMKAGGYTAGEMREGGYSAVELLLAVPFQDEDSLPFATLGLESWVWPLSGSDGNAAASYLPLVGVTPEAPPSPQTVQDTKPPATSAPLTATVATAVTTTSSTGATTCSTGATTSSTGATPSANSRTMDSVIDATPCSNSGTIRRMLMTAFTGDWLPVAGGGSSSDAVAPPDCTSGDS